MSAPRCHFNRRGEPKPALTREEAIGQALQYEYDRQVDSRTRDRGPVNAYECACCGAWHVGTPGLHRRRPVMRVELGDRAWWNLDVENRGPEILRRWQLGERGRRSAA